MLGNCFCNNYINLLPPQFQIASMFPSQSWEKIRGMLHASQNYIYVGWKGEKVKMTIWPNFPNLVLMENYVWARKEN